MAKVLLRTGRGGERGCPPQVLALAPAVVGDHGVGHVQDALGTAVVLLEADDLGLSSLSSVARDSRICLERADSTAFSAVWARLLRVAERSLSPGSDMVDLSG